MAGGGNHGKTVFCGVALGLALFLIHGVQVDHGLTPSTAAASTGAATAPASTATSTAVPAAVWPSDEDVDCGVVSCIALTFDDGPSQYTSQLLDVLGAANVHATFFVVGREIAAHTDEIAREAAQGNEIGNHTWSHADLTKLSAEAASAELTRTADAVQAITGVRPTLVRPPYGAYDQAVDQLVGGPEILWNVDPRDWEDPDTAAVTQRVIDAAKPGAIVIMHDVRGTTVAAIPAILEGLLAKGLHPVTVSRLLTGDSVRAGVAYSHR